MCNKNAILKLAISAYVCIMVVATESVWTEIIKKNIGTLVDAIIKSLEIPFINVATFMAIICVLVYSSFRIFEKHKFNIYLYPILISITWLLQNGHSWVPVETFISGWYFNQLVSIAIVFSLIMMIIAELTYNPNKNNINKYNPNGFAIDTEFDNLVEIGWNSYCETLVSKLYDTDLSKECFAVGVTGYWGAGKTTFLNSLTPALKQKFQVVQFNPWVCRNANQIVEEFFKQLNSVIDNNSQLSESLHDYADALDNFDAFPWLTRIISTFSTNHKKTLTELKEKVNELARQNARPFVIIIDDIDRLDSDEVLEVLHLIRITANLSNLVFVVAYDSRHVVKMLHEKGIDNGEEYLHKMFQLEFALPAYEEYKIPQVLYKELQRAITDKNVLQILKKKLLESEDNKYILNQHIRNFRDAKRFTNAFCLNFQQIQQTLSLTEFEVEDLFWLELLHYSDKGTYRNLIENRQFYLDEEQTGKGTICYRLKDDKNLTKEISPSTLTLLKRLFPKDKEVSRLSVGYEENYLRYFTFRLPEHKISSSTLIAILNNSISETELSRKLNELITGNYIKQLSLISQISVIRISDLTSKCSVHNYLYMLVWSVCWYKIEYVRSMLPKQLDVRLFPDERQRNECAADLKRMIKEAISNTYDLYQWAKIFSCLYPICYWDYEEGEFHERHDPQTILSKGDIIELAKINFHHFIERLGTLPPLSDLTYNNTPLHHFLKASTTIESMQEGDEDNAKTQCLVLESLIEFYKKQSNNDFKSFTSHLEEDEKYGYGYDDYLNDYLTTIRSTLGEYNDYEQLVRECFSLTPEEIEQHLIKTHIKSPKESSRYKQQDPPEIYY